MPGYGGAEGLGVELLLVPLAAYLFLSGLDDLAVDLLRLWRRRGRPVQCGGPEPRQPEAARTAILIPMWQEAAVAAAMLRHNLAALRYPDFELFVGVYPNDPATRAVVEECAAEDGRIHVCLAPRDGPTSKADCLNAIWRGVQEAERAGGGRFEMLVLHDAEDLIHPESLSVYSAGRQDWGMIQFPVLPLATPGSEWTHGVYCDDFAESQGFDLSTRAQLGAFLPGCGVGTAFRRDVLDALAEGGDPFDESLLTEDYETGLRLYRMGVAQRFVPLEFRDGQPLATREYFPRSFSGAVKQRGRWVAGNSLQSWRRHGWQGREDGGWRARWAQTWFLWRDRKGLWGNPVSLFCNLLFMWGVASGAATRLDFSRWPWVETLLGCNLALLLSRTGFRMWASGRVYGWRFSLGVLPRMVWGNAINALATARAWRLWLAHRWAGRELAWGKTAHRYPAPAGLAEYKRPIEEILIEERMLAAADCAWAARQRAEGEDLTASLLRLRLLTEEQVYEAFSLQQGIPLARLAPDFQPGRIACALPEALQEKWQVVPYRVEPGRLFVAAARPPTEEMEAEIRRWTRLDVRFRLLPPARFQQMRNSARGMTGYNPENGTTHTGPDPGRAAGAGAD
jgi:adsorption protein B